MRLYLVQALWVFLLLTLTRPPEIVAQSESESLNFCDISCVQNVYRFYCGDAKCTTGASDYAQIFDLCTERCAGAVAGEAMAQCLTTTVPDRNDWDQVQESVLQEIVSFCTGFEIAVDPDVTPLSIKKTDKELLDSLFDEPPEPESDGKKKKGKRRSKKKKKNKHGKKERENDENEEPEQEEREDKAEPKKMKGKENNNRKNRKRKASSTKRNPPNMPTEPSKKKQSRRQPPKETKAQDEKKSPPRNKKKTSKEFSVLSDQNEEAMGSVAELEKDVDVEESFDSEFDSSASLK